MDAICGFRGKWQTVCRIVLDVRGVVGQAVWSTAVNMWGNNFLYSSDKLEKAFSVSLFVPRFACVASACV